MCFICKLTFEHFILLREVLNYVQSDDARTGVYSPYKLVSHTSVGCLCQAISSRFEVEVSSLYTLCKKKKKNFKKSNSVFVDLHMAVSLCSQSRDLLGSLGSWVESRGRAVVLLGRRACSTSASLCRSSSAGDISGSTFNCFNDPPAGEALTKLRLLSSEGFAAACEEPAKPQRSSMVRWCSLEVFPNPNKSILCSNHHGAVLQARWWPQGQRWPLWKGRGRTYRACPRAARRPCPPPLSCRGCWGTGSHLFPPSCHWQSRCRAEHEEGWCLHPSSCGAPCCSVRWGGCFGCFPQSLGSPSPWGRCGRSRCPCCRCTPCTPRAARSLWGKKGKLTR